MKYYYHNWIKFQLTSLLQDLIGDINDLKDGQNKNSNEIDNLSKNYKSLIERFNQFEKLKNNMVCKQWAYSIFK